MRSLRVLTPFLFILTVFFGAFVFAFAQGSGNGPSPNSAPQADPVLKEERQAAKEAELSIKSQQRVINLAANISNQIDASIRRYTNITNRLENRINKMKLEGYDTSVAEVEFATAKLLLEDVFIRMINVDADVYDAVTSEDPRTAWQSIRVMLLDVRAELKELHAALNATVAALRDAPMVTETLAEDVLESTL